MRKGRSLFHSERTLTTTDSRTGTTTIGGYLENGAPISLTEPGSRTTAFTYDVMGRRLSIDAPDSLDSAGNNLTNITYSSYTARGEIAGNWGGQTNPTFRIYDSLGRMFELRTYQNLSSAPLAAQAGSAKTTWLFSPERGFLTGKRDDAAKGASYTYTPAGRLLTRTWARSSVATPKITTYAYDAGMMISTNYSDATPDIAMSYDHFGRPITQTNGLAASTFAYDPDTLALDTETITYSLPGHTVFTRILDRSRDNLLRDTGFQLKNAATVENQATYNYQATEGRLGNVANPSSQFTYGYEPNSYGLIKTVAGPIHTVCRVSPFGLIFFCCASRSGSHRNIFSIQTPRQFPPPPPPPIFRVRSEWHCFKGKLGIFRDGGFPCIPRAGR